MKINKKSRIKQTSLLFCKYLANKSSDLFEIFYSIQLLSCELNFKISKWSRLLLRRYLQNNTDVCLILNFQCNLHNFKIWASKFKPNLKNTWNSLEFLQALFQNDRTSLEFRLEYEAQTFVSIIINHHVYGVIGWSLLRWWLIAIGSKGQRCCQD